MSLENASFRGGVHMHDFKELTNDKPVVPGSRPTTVTIPLQQHIGVPCEALVGVGDVVKVGEKIGESKAFMSVPVHASVSGQVTAITEIATTAGTKCMAITIESDGNEEIGYVKPGKAPEDLSPEEIVALVKEAGIVGMGGAAFPTHIKLSPPADQPIDTVLVNGAECEPYLTADQMIMESEADKVIGGLLLAMKAVKAEKGFICIETNKPRAIEIMKQKVAAHSQLEVVTLKPKYPQGDEKRLIDAATKRVVPSGGLPMNIGVVVINAYTAHSIYEAVHAGKPLIERIVTVTGHGVKNPINVMSKVGVSLRYLLEEAQGLQGTPGKVIIGGPMMGATQFSIDAPVSKATGGMLVLTKEEAKPPKMEACIKCGKCVDACPVFLQPLYIARSVDNDLMDNARELHAMDCIECGSCSYICPAKRPLVELIKLGKQELRKKSQRV